MSVVRTLEELKIKATELFLEGDLVLIEGYCSGEEITVSVFPPGEYDVGLFLVSNSYYPCTDSKLKVGLKESHWALPLVTRFNHIGGIAQYNGVVAGQSPPP